MGIKDLSAFLKEHAPSSISKGNLSSLGKDYSTPQRRARAAIDTSLFMYKYKYRAQDDFINEFLEQINRLLVNNIEPIYVFDGAPPVEKKETIQIRKDRHRAMEDKIKTLESDIKLLSEQDSDDSIEKDTIVQKQKALTIELEKTKRKSVVVTSSDTNKLKYFLEIMNIPYIRRDSEADLVCSKLAQLGFVDFVISEDMDHLTSGTTMLLRDFNNRNNAVTIYNSKVAKNEIELDNDKWIELCIMFGCDYVPRIRGLGYKTSYKYIKLNKTLPFTEIVGLIRQKPKYTISDDYLDKVLRAKLIFINDVDFNLGEYLFKCNKDLYDNQIEVVKTYLKKYTRFSDQKIKNRIKNIYGYCI